MQHGRDIYSSYQDVWWDGTGLKKVRYVPQLKKNLIVVSALEALSLEISGRDGVLNMLRGSMVMMKGIRWNNVYYLKGNTFTVQVETYIGSNDDCTRLWHIRLEHAGKKSLQTLANQGLLKGAKTCKLEFCEHCLIGKKIKVKFGTAIHYTEEILDYVHTGVGDLPRWYLLEITTTLCPLLMISLCVVRYISRDTKEKS